MNKLKKYFVLQKPVGQTPLECMEAWRAKLLQAPLSSRSNLELGGNTPLTYAGRLDPMASGKLLVLVGDECKQKNNYNELDKEYHFSVLFGISSDTGDVLGLPTISTSSRLDLELSMTALVHACRRFVGAVELPYPHYSAKTVAGKPLHTWTLEGRLDEITIPTKQSRVYALKPTKLESISMTDVHTYVSNKIETIAPITDTKKALGNDFRRPLIRPAWQALTQEHHAQTFYLAEFNCVASSGTYMRTLAGEIATAVGTTGLAWHIHRNTIGHYQPLPLGFGFFKKKFK